MLRRFLKPGGDVACSCGHYHEKSVDEVAHILDVPAATVKTRMFYARKKLAELVNAAEKARC
jgi:DNA-directed RNA polymerase specialized sigma24 family protein